MITQLNVDQVGQMEISSCLHLQQVVIGQITVNFQAVVLGTLVMFWMQLRITRREIVLLVGSIFIVFRMFFFHESQKKRNCICDCSIKDKMLNDSLVVLFTYVEKLKFLVIIIYLFYYQQNLYLLIYIMSIVILCNL